MRVAVASGKGGTGKTLIATNLAWLLADRQGSTTYVDCDVEAPNGHLFLWPEEIESRRFALPIPVVDEARCTGCGDCQRFCSFHAILAIGAGEVMVFPELCHGCGGCERVCPEQAITERGVETGSVLWGRAGPGGRLRYLAGRLDVGQPRAAPLIEALVKGAPRGGTVVIDAPPGTSCNAIAALRGADHVVLVTEPTPFGLHDLRLAVAVCKSLEVSSSAIINRADLGDDAVARYLEGEGIPIVAEVPFEWALSEAYTRGELGQRYSPRLRQALHLLMSHLGLSTLEEAAP